MITTTDLCPLEEQCEWRRDELGDRYVFRLTAAYIDELDAALVEAESRRDDVLDITRDDFPLPSLGPELVRIQAELINGRGVVLIRGLPVDGYGKQRASTIYWGVGMHLGRPWPQNVKGHLLGDVTDQGRALDDPTARGNEIGAVAFPFRRLRSRRALLSERRRERWREPRRQRGRHPQRAGAQRARARGIALRRIRVRLSWRAGTRREAVVHDAGLQPPR
jgi:hypothetical protein